MFLKINGFLRLKLIAFLGVLSFVLISVPVYGQIVGQEVYSKLNVQDQVRVIVVLKSGSEKYSTLNAKMESIKNNKLRVLSGLDSDQFKLANNWETINAFSGFITITGINQLQNDPDVLKIDIDPAGGGGLFQSVPLINADDVVNTGFTGQGVSVAILDTGVDSSNSNLNNDITAEHCFCENMNGSGCCPNGAVEQGGSNSAEDDNGHGTNISGIVTSDGDLTTPTGVAPGSNIVVVKVLDEDNSFSNISQIISGLEWVLMNHPEVDVLNMSLGTDVLFEDICDDNSAVTIAFFQAVQNLVESNVVVFASSQNEGSINSIALPACLSNTISVGAVYDADNGSVSVFGCEDSNTFADKVACFSNSSKDLDLLAPGSKITSTGLGLGGLSTQSGTSQASAHAAATAALLKSAVPGLTPAQIRNALRQTGVTVVDQRNGRAFPRINALAALNFVTGLDIKDNGNTTSICSLGGPVSEKDAMIILMIYLIPIMFVISRRMIGYWKNNQ